MAASLGYHLALVGTALMRSDDPVHAGRRHVQCRQRENRGMSLFVKICGLAR